MLEDKKEYQNSDIPFYHAETLWTFPFALYLVFHRPSRFHENRSFVVCNTVYNWKRERTNRHVRLVNDNPEWTLFRRNPKDGSKKKGGGEKKETRFSSYSSNAINESFFSTLSGNTIATCQTGLFLISWDWRERTELTIMSVMVKCF
jgi:hypothetical protein